MKRFRNILILGLGMLVFAGSCKPLKAYEKVFVNDPDMQMGATADAKFKSYVHSIREGAVEAAAKKGSGGCGCN